VSLVGAVLTETLPIWYGTGGNGKSTTVSVIMKLLGDYACKAAPDLLAQSKWDRHPTEVADLCGRRVAFSVEMDRLKHLDEARVKDLTGGDRKKARFSHQDFFEFEQTFSLFLIVNQKPVVTGTDWGIWRRLRLVPWEYTIPDSERRDQDTVIAELLTEADGIMNWLIDGLADYYNDLYWMADEVKALTEEYRAEMDILGEFIEDCCELKPSYSVEKSEFYAAYEEWCEENREKPVSKKAFTSMLKDRGIRDGRSKRYRFYVGIGLKDSNDNWSDTSENRNSELENDVVTHGDTFSVNSRETKISIGFTEKPSPSVTHDNSELDLDDLIATTTPVTVATVCPVTATTPTPMTSHTTAPSIATTSTAAMGGMPISPKGFYGEITQGGNADIISKITQGSAADIISKITQPQPLKSNLNKLINDANLVVVKPPKGDDASILNAFPDDYVYDDDPFSIDDTDNLNDANEFDYTSVDADDSTPREYPKTLDELVKDGEKPLDVYLRTRPERDKPAECLKCHGSDFRWEEEAYRNKGDWVCNKCEYTYFRGLVEAYISKG
jgi:P4 family phage/plasmid primase-like protien